MPCDSVNLPPLSAPRRWNRHLGWRLVGSVIPFFPDSPMAQETVNSSLAALYTGPVHLSWRSWAISCLTRRMSAGSVVGVLIGSGGLSPPVRPRGDQGLGSAVRFAQLLLVAQRWPTAMSRPGSAGGAPLMSAIPSLRPSCRSRRSCPGHGADRLKPGRRECRWKELAAVAGPRPGPTAFAQALHMLLIRDVRRPSCRLTAYCHPRRCRGARFACLRRKCRAGRSLAPSR